MALYEWRWMVWIVIPSSKTARDAAAAVLPRIWGDTAEEKNYDSIRASASGLEPATHLMAVIPAKARQAKLMKLLCVLAGADDPTFPTNINPTQADIDTYQTIRNASAKFVVAITDRLDQNNNLITSNYPVKYIDERFPNVTQIPSVDAALQRVNLVRIVPTDGQ